MQLKNFEIPLKINIPAGFEAGRYPVEVGIPLYETAITDVSQIRLFTNNQVVPVDCSPLMFWPDGSLRWVLLRFIAEKASYIIRPCNDPEEPYPFHLSMRQDEKSIQIDTSTAVFFLSNTEFRLELPQQSCFAGADLRDAQNRLCKFIVENTEIEHIGRISAVILVKGRFIRSLNSEICKGECRLSFWADTGLVRFEFTLWNPKAARHKGGLWDLGDPGSIFFRSLHFPFIFKTGFKTRQLSLNPGETFIKAPDNELSVFQGSSGGTNWRSLAHVDCNNKPTPKFQGYRLNIGGNISEGLRCNPAVACETDNGNHAFAMENFWQCFPNRLFASEKMVSVEPFPGADNQKFELQGGEKATVRFWADFNCGNNGDKLLYARAPVVPTIPVEWYAQSGFMPGFAIPERPRDTWLDEMIDSGINGPNSFFDRRETFDEYGWRNFGDTPADHEKQHYKGNREFVSHYNNQYDLILGFLHRFASTGDTRWFELGRDLARHVIDHDLYSTSRDKSAFNGGYFWHTAHYCHAGTATHRCYSKKAIEDGSQTGNFGGGPSNEHNYTSGLTLYFLLTGDVRAKHAVLQLSKWVRDMQDPWKTPFRFLSRNPTGRATNTRDYDYNYQGPGRGGAYSINACLDAYILTSNKNWMDIADKYLRTCVHPSIDPDDLQLLNREDRWSYVVFLQEIGRYLELKQELNKQDDTCHYAKTVLLNFARWMVEHEYPFLDRPEELEYPTSTWAAQDLRKSATFQFALKYGDTDLERSIFEEKAAFFKSRSGDYLKKYNDCASTRNLALMLAFYPAQPEHLINKFANSDFSTNDFGKPVVFSPQKMDAMYKFRRILRSLGVAALPELINFIKDIRKRG